MKFTNWELKRVIAIHGSKIYEIERKCEGLTEIKKVFKDELSFYLDFNKIKPEFDYLTEEIQNLSSKGWLIPAITSHLSYMLNMEKKLLSVEVTKIFKRLQNEL